MAKPRPDPDSPDPQLALFGTSLLRERRKAGLSQRHLAELALMSQTEVSLFERGMRAPRLPAIVNLARALHLTPSELLRDLR